MSYAKYAGTRRYVGKRHGYRSASGVGGSGRADDYREHAEQGDGEQLRARLRRLDGAGYAAYRSLTGDWRFDRCVLRVIRVQGDPFAPPSRVEVRVPAEVAGLPADLYDTADRQRALASFLARQICQVLGEGPVRIDAGGQEVLDRSCVRLREDGSLVWRAAVRLPGRGRRIDGPAATEILCERLPDAVDATCFDALDPDAARHFVDTVEDTTALRDLLPAKGLLAFVGDGSRLARRSGVDERPLADQVPWHSPDSLAVTVDLPHRGRVRGMGIPEGVTLIVGGGFHGKSTLLRALESGVYDHVPGDGRELVATVPDAVKVRSEDGRAVTRVDVSAFVRHLPSGSDTSDFSTGNASGSTSQAASLVEAVEVGARAVLLDEDTTATNVMIRDARMRELVSAEQEPLTPFVDLVRSLHRDRGVSTVLVMGGSGDYLDVADHVLMMDGYRPFDVTDRAAKLAEVNEHERRFPPIGQRWVDPSSMRAIAKGRTRIRAHGVDSLSYGDAEIDLRALDQLVDVGQATGVGLVLAALSGERLTDNALADALSALEDWFDLEFDALDALAGGFTGDFALPRRFEVAAALNRLRTLNVRGIEDPRPP